MGDYSRRRLIEGWLLFEDCLLSKIILSHLFFLEGYIMVWKDRAGSRTDGDVAMICRDDWKSKALNVTDSLVGDHNAL